MVRELRSGFFPFCEPVAAFRSAGDTDYSIANQLTIADGSGTASSVHTRPPPSWSAVHIHGPAECGQHEVAAAVLQLLGQSGQSIPVHGLDLVSLSASVSTRTLEEAAVGVVHQAAVVTPSILFLPHLQVIMRTGYEQLRTIIMGAIEYVFLGSTHVQSLNFLHHIHSELVLKVRWHLCCDSGNVRQAASTVSTAAGYIGCAYITAATRCTGVSSASRRWACTVCHSFHVQQPWRWLLAMT